MRAWPTPIVPVETPNSRKTIRPFLTSSGRGAIWPWAGDTLQFPLESLISPNRAAIECPDTPRILAATESFARTTRSSCKSQLPGGESKESRFTKGEGGRNCAERSSLRTVSARSPSHISFICTTANILRCQGNLAERPVSSDGKTMFSYTSR